MATPYAPPTAALGSCLQWWAHHTLFTRWRKRKRTQQACQQRSNSTYTHQPKRKGNATPMATTTNHQAVIAALKTLGYVRIAAKLYRRKYGQHTVSVKLGTPHGTKIAAQYWQVRGPYAGFNVITTAKTLRGIKAALKAAPLGQFTQ